MVVIKTEAGDDRRKAQGSGFGCAIAILLVLTVFLVLSWATMGFWLWLALGEFQKSKASSNYATCQGVVVSIGHDIETESLEIEFDYTVDGEKYQNSTFRDPRNYPSSQKKDWSPKNMTTGGIVTVYYDPDNPSESRLVPGVLSDDWGFLFSIPLFLVLVVVTWKFIQWMFEIKSRLHKLNSRESNSF